MIKKMYIIVITAMILISSIIIISYNNTLNDNKAVLHIDTSNNIITETTNENNTENTNNTEPEETLSQNITDYVPDDTDDIEDTIDTEDTIDDTVDEPDTPPNPSNDNPSPSNPPDNTPDKLLLILSPQYKDDSEILDVINKYQNAVFDDIGWNSLIHSLSDEENHYDTLFDIIKNYYQEGNENLKAVMLIGEDIHLELGAEFDDYGGIKKEESPRLFYIATLQKEATYVKEGYKILPTMIFPNACDSYEVKKDQLIFTFNKFSNRTYEYGDRVCGYNWPTSPTEEQPNRNQYFESVIKPFGNTTWLTNAPSISGLLDGKYKMVFLSGHASASYIYPSYYNNQAQIVRTYDYLDTHDIITPVLLLSGCYSNGWGGTDGTNGILDPPNPYYVAYNFPVEFHGHTILTNDNLRLYMGGQGGVCGSAHGIATKTHIFENLSMGKTFAESMLNFPVMKSKHTFYGDPTYHYPITNIYSETTGPYTSPEYKQVVNHPIQFKSYTLNGARPFSYHWDFGDGTTSTEQSPVHTFSHRGTYNVSFYITDNNQNSIEKTAIAKISSETVIVNQSFDGETNGWMIDRFNNITYALDTIYTHAKTIIIQSGTYDETDLLIDRQLEIIGDDKHTTIINITEYFQIRGTENVSIKNVTFKNVEEFCIIASKNITVSDSIIMDSTYGVALSRATNCSITKNIIKNIYAISVTRSDNNLISENTIENNEYGIYLDNSRNNTIYLNNFINNSISINDTTGLNTYNVSTYGNYYSDYTTLYPDAETNYVYDHSVWSIPYEITTDCFDMYPSINPFPFPISIAKQSIGIELGIESVDSGHIPDSPRYNTPDYLLSL